jgi:methyltransferase-like protein
LEIFVEFFKDVEYDQISNVKRNKTSEVNNILDYYDKVLKLPFKVRKFVFEIRNSLNEILLEYRDFPLKENDTLQFEYLFHDLGYISKEEYMDFLHNAYKEDSLLLESENSGNWSIKNQKLSPN